MACDHQTTNCSYPDTQIAKADALFWYPPQHAVPGEMYMVEVAYTTGAMSPVKYYPVMIEIGAWFR